MSNDQIPLFEKNLQFFSTDVRQRVNNIHTTELWEKIEILHTQEGYPICNYKEHGQHFQMNSIQPLKEVTEWCTHLSLEDAGCIFLYGGGFGYPLFELHKQKQENTMIIVFEQNIYLFAAMLHYFDLEPLFKTNKFKFFIGDSKDIANEFHTFFYSEVFLYTTNPFVVFTPTALRNFKREYLVLHSYIFKELSLNVFYMGNDHSDTLLGFHNQIANVKEVITNPYLGILKDQFQKIPAFIISNGPSLDKNIQELKKINGNGLIISTESAIVSLAKNQIEPDILSIVERTKYTYEYHFKDRNLSNRISLLALALIDSHVYPAFTGPRIPIFRSTESINQWINRIIGDQSSALDAGANVSHLAFETAVYLGCNPIIFVGQDFAFGENGKTHSKDAAYHEEKGKEIISKIKEKPVVYVENNEGKMIPTTQLWVDFKQGLERKIALHLDKKIINATEGGARIEGTTCIPLHEVIQQYCIKPLPYRVNEKIMKEKNKINLQEREKKLDNLIKELQLYIQQFRQLCQFALKGRIRSKQMLELTSSELDDETLHRLEKAYEENYLVLKHFMDDNLYLVFLQQVLVVGFHQMNRLGSITSIDRVKQLFMIHDELFENLNLICQSVVVNFEMAIDKLNI